MESSFLIFMNGHFFRRQGTLIPSQTGIMKTKEITFMQGYKKIAPNQSSTQIAKFSLLRDTLLYLALNMISNWSTCITCID